MVKFPKNPEGSILLIDSTQGVQAQTLTTLAMAREGGLKIIPVLSKIDSPLSRVSEVRGEVVDLLNCDPDEILLVSGRTFLNILVPLFLGLDLYRCIIMG